MFLGDAVVNQLHYVFKQRGFKALWVQGIASEMLKMLQSQDKFNQEAVNMGGNSKLTQNLRFLHLYSPLK